MFSYNLLMLLLGLVLMMATYSYATFRLKIPSRVPMVMVQRIKNSHLSEKELENKYKPFLERLLQPVAEIIVKNVKLNRLSRLELEEKLEMAGVNKTPEEFMAKQVTTGLGFVAFSLIWVVLLKTPVILLAGLVLGAFGMTLPTRELDKKIEEKKSFIIMELPDFLDMLVLSLRAGRNLYSAVKKASEQSGPTLRPLLERLQADLELVENKKDALWKFAENTGIQEVKDFVSALEIGMDAKAAQAEEIYRSQSKTMRDLRVLALRKHTKSIPARLGMLHAWLYFNCIAIPIVGAVMQFISISNQSI